MRKRCAFWLLVPFIAAALSLEQATESLPRFSCEQTCSPERRDASDKQPGHRPAFRDAAAAWARSAPQHRTPFYPKALAHGQRLFLPEAGQGVAAPQCRSRVTKPPVTANSSPRSPPSATLPSA